VIYMRLTQAKIYKRYKTIRKHTFIAQVLTVTLLPLFAILMYLSKQGSVLGGIIVTFGILLIVYLIFVFFILRRCPNCLSLFSKHVFDPKICPYCGVKLRE